MRKSNKCIKNKIKNIWETISMPAVATGIILFLSAVGGVILSGVLFNACPWISNVLISACCGIITGLVLYVLTNIRANSYSKAKREYDLLSKAKREAADTIKDVKYYVRFHCLWNEEIDADSFFTRLYNKVEGMQTLIFDEFSWEMYQEIGLEENNPIDYSFTEKLWEAYIAVEDKNEDIDDLLNCIVEKMEQLVLMLQNPTLRRNSKLSKYEKFSL